MTLAHRDLDEVADELDAVVTPETVAAFRPRFNIAPTDVHLLLRLAGHERHLDPALWGFKGRGKSPLLINARAETVASRAAFRAAFGGQRCVVPADGFYEWSGQGADRQPFWIRRADGRLLLFAGLYEEDHAASPRSGLAIATGLRFTVITTSANTFMARLHDRMPVILDPADVEAWLESGPGELLRPAREAALLATPASKRVNSVKNDDPACLVPETSGRGQLPLF